MATPEIRGGLFPLLAMGMLHRHLAPKTAFRMFYSGEPLTGQDAADAGLLTEVVGPEDLDAAVARWCDRLAVADPDAVSCGRRAYWQMADLEQAGRLALGGRALQQLISSSPAAPRQDYMTEAIDPQDTL